MISKDMMIGLAILLFTLVIAAAFSLSQLSGLGGGCQDQLFLKQIIGKMGELGTGGGGPPC